MLCFYDHIFAHCVLKAMTLKNPVSLIKIIHVHTNDRSILRKMIRSGHINCKSIGALQPHASADDPFGVPVLMTYLKTQKGGSHHQNEK